MATKRVSENKVVLTTGAAAAPARRKSVAPKRESRPANVEIPTTPEVVTVETVIEYSNDAVATLAYSYWEARGYQGGSPEEDWLRAEQELRATLTAK